jgi:hypothetical protein
MPKKKDKNTNINVKLQIIKDKLEGGVQWATVKIGDGTPDLGFGPPLLCTQY